MFMNWPLYFIVYRNSGISCLGVHCHALWWVYHNASLVVHRHANERLLMPMIDDPAHLATASWAISVIPFFGVTLSWIVQCEMVSRLFISKATILTLSFSVPHRVLCLEVRPNYRVQRFHVGADRQFTSRIYQLSGRSKIFPAIVVLISIIQGCELSAQLMFKH